MGINVKVHPAAAIFPIVGEADLKALADDIKRNGQIHPIIFQSGSGVLVDGRNRLQACELAGVAPRIEEREFKTDGEIIAFIVSANERRRHLDTSQRAMIAAELASLGKTKEPAKAPPEAAASKTKSGGKDVPEKADKIREEPKAPQMSAKQAATLLNVSERSVSDAQKVQSQAPELVEKVKSGEISVSAAAKLADNPKLAKQVASGEKDAKASVKDERDKAKKDPVKREPKDPDASAKLKKDNERLKNEVASAEKKIDELNLRIETMGNEMSSMAAELKSLNGMLSANDGLKEAAAEVKSYREQLGAAKSRVDGLMREKNQAVSELRRANRKIDSLIKEKESLESVKDSVVAAGGPKKGK